MEKAMGIPLVEVQCTNCGCTLHVPADDECLIAWEGCYCSDECMDERFGYYDDPPQGDDKEENDE